jgi:chaperone modulatory protein CbpM
VVVGAETPEPEWLDDRGECPVGELAQQSRFLEVEILELMHCGAIPRQQGRALSAARMAARLRQDFELDLQGVALALTLLRRIDELEGELARLRLMAP